MYSNKKKFEIYTIFLFVILSLELLTTLILGKKTFELYSQIQHLPWVIPNKWLFLLWAVLYILIAFSGAIIWIKRHSHIGTYCLWTWIIQIFLNIIWPFCFVYISFQILTPILITIMFMDLLVLIFYSFLLNRIAGCFLIPYFLMVVYKLLFHWMFFILNIQLV